MGEVLDSEIEYLSLEWYMENLVRVLIVLVQSKTYNYLTDSEPD